LDVFEMEIYVKTGALPIRHLRPRHFQMQRVEYGGSGCVIDLAPGRERTSSLTFASLLDSLGVKTTKLLFESTKVTDKQGDIAAATLGHMLNSLSPYHELFMTEGQRRFDNILSVCDLMVSASPQYHHVVHNFYLAGMAPDASESERLSHIIQGQGIDDLLIPLEGTFQGVLNMNDACALIRKMTVRSAFCEGTQCAIVYGPDTTSSDAHTIHHFAVLWELSNSECFPESCDEQEPIEEMFATMDPFVRVD
jgi:hypothetical protein